MYHHSYFCLLGITGLCKHIIFLIIECGIVHSLCTMRAVIFNDRASSSSHRLPCASFVSVTPSIAELAHGEKLRTQSITQSLNHSPRLFDVPGTEAFASESCMHTQLGMLNEVRIFELRKKYSNSNSFLTLRSSTFKYRLA